MKEIDIEEEPSIDLIILRPDATASTYPGIVATFGSALIGFTLGFVGARSLEVKITFL